MCLTIASRLWEERVGCNCCRGIEVVFQGYEWELKAFLIDLYKEPRLCATAFDVTQTLSKLHKGIYQKRTKSVLTCSFPYFCPLFFILKCTEAYKKRPLKAYINRDLGTRFWSTIVLASNRASSTFGPVSLSKKTLAIHRIRFSAYKLDRSWAGIMA